MTRTHRYLTTLNDEAETDVEVEYSATGGCSAHYGDLNYPGHPAEAPEIEIIKVRDKAGNVMTLTDAQAEFLELQIAENGDEPSDDYWEEYDR